MSRSDAALNYKYVAWCLGPQSGIGGAQPPPPMDPWTDGVVNDEAILSVARLPPAAAERRLILRGLMYMYVAAALAAALDGRSLPRPRRSLPHKTPAPTGADDVFGQGKLTQAGLDVSLPFSTSVHRRWSEGHGSP